MVSSAEVLNVLSEIKNIFTALNNEVASIDGSWEGDSKNSILSQIKTFSSEVCEIISSQLSNLASAVELAKEYNDLKEKYKLLEQQYKAALSTDSDCSWLLSEMAKCLEKINQLKEQIINLLNLITERSIVNADNSSSEMLIIEDSSSFNSFNDYPVDEYGIVIKNDGIPRSGTAAEKQAYLFPNGRPKSAAEADPYMIRTTVEYIDVNGNRQSAQIRVHKALEEDVKEIFSKIADTGFKMKPSDYGNGAYVESYFFKDNGTSEHCLGAAVDINVADNPYTKVSRDTAAGSNYNPNNNEYAITEEVANIFRSYGWSWGGADWNSNKTGRIYDYMHFDFTELGPQSQK